MGDNKGFSFGGGADEKKTTPSLFGNNAPAASSTSGGLFGNMTSATTSSTPGSGLFGGGSSFPTSGSSSNAGNIFGTPLGSTNAAGGLFGSTANAEPSSKPSFPSLGASTGQPSTSGTASSGSLFGSTGGPSSNLFGGASSGQPGGMSGFSTLSSKKADDNKQGSDNFTTPSKSAPQSNPSISTPANGSAPPATSTTPLFSPPTGGNLFGKGSAPRTDASSLFGNVTKSDKPSNTAQSSNEASKPSFSLGGPQDTSKEKGTTTPLFSPTGVSNPQSLPPTSAAAPAAPSLFGGTPKSSSNSSSTNPFSGLGGPKPSAPNTSATGGSTTATSGSSTLFPPSSSSSATNAGSTPNLFGQKTTSQPPASTSTSNSLANGSQSQSATASQPASQATSSATIGGTAKADGSGAATGNPPSAPAAASTGATGFSNAGPAPSQQSRLKNKTMDEIVTRWASDLSKYQKEFQSQAEKVANWDRLLVENSNAITKLYSTTFRAERDTAEVQKQLSAVEDHQSELAQWLDKYEHEVEELMAKEGVGQREGLQGPDQERERTYKSAERVYERLGDMGNELTGLIEEINSVSATLTNTSKPDDPLSQIVRVLNGHLSQLQQIDQDTSSLQAKVRDAQKESQRLGARGQGLNHAADDFYRSYMGRG